MILISDISSWIDYNPPQYTESPKNPAYIASQGPLQNCAGDFWQMVWEQGVSEIIMLSLNDGIDVSQVSLNHKLSEHVSYSNPEAQFNT